jgi:hypothetical protein
MKHPQGLGFPGIKSQQWIHPTAYWFGKHFMKKVKGFKIFLNDLF